MFTDAQKLVMQILKINEVEYAELIYVHGIKQIAKLLPGLTSLDDVESSEVFWSDFKKRWAQQDEAFIEELSIDDMDNLIGAKKCDKETEDAWKNYHLNAALESLPVGVQRIVLNQLAREHNKVPVLQKR